MPYVKRNGLYYRHGKGYTKKQVTAIHFAKMRRRKKKKR